MNISFKTHFPWNGRDGKPEPTFFPDKILLALDRHPEPEITPLLLDPAKKYHTIRRIKDKPRYKEGMKLTMCTGSRFKPVPFLETECTGTQEIIMEIQDWSAGGHPLSLAVFGQDGYRMSIAAVEVLAANDGLSARQFYKWFTMDCILNGPGRFQVVHWGNINY